MISDQDQSHTATAGRQAFLSTTARRCLGWAAAALVSLALVTGIYLTWQKQIRQEQLRWAQEAARQGDFDRAITNYSEAIRLNPQGADAYYYRAYAYWKKGDLDRAITDLSEAIRLNPQDALAYHNRGNAYSAKGDLDRAITDLSEAIRLNPEYTLAYHNRGNAYSSKGDLDRTLADYTKANRLRP